MNENATALRASESAPKLVWIFQNWDRIQRKRGKEEPVSEGESVCVCVRSLADDSTEESDSMENTCDTALNMVVHLTVLQPFSEREGERECSEFPTLSLHYKYTYVDVDVDVDVYKYLNMWKKVSERTITRDGASEAS